MQQIQSTLSSRYQTVVPADVRKVLRLEAGDKILWRLVRTGGAVKAVAEPRPKSWAAYSLGLGKAIWEKTNIDQYIQQLRDEWNKND